MTLRWSLLLLVLPLALAACTGEEETEAPEPSVTASAAMASPTARASLPPSATPHPPPSPTPFPTPPPSTTPEPTEVALTTTPAPPEHLLGVFVVAADGSGEPLKVADDGFVEGWSPDGALIGVSTLDPDQSGCMVAPAACFRELCVVRADGQGQAVSLGDAQVPMWSARENKLLFYRLVRGPFTTASGHTFTGITAKEICVADAATGATTVLASNGPITRVDGETVTTVGSYGDWPRWPPDESRVLFGFGSGLYVAKADGSQAPARVADGNIYEADWSPDGQQIVYSWGGEIYTVAADGSDSPRKLVIGHQPDWSPDGSRIAFIAKTLPTTEIWLLDPATGESDKLVDVGLPNVSPTLVWSPEGNVILYVAAGAIYCIAPEGDAPPRKLADGGWPVWSPDGKRVAFTRGFDRPDGAPLKSQLFVVNADGSGLTLLADDLTRSCVTYARSPNSQRIAFSSIYCPLS